MQQEQIADGHTPHQQQQQQQQTPPQKRSRLERINQRISQLEMQKKELERKASAKQRKAHTRRLMEIGRITLKYLECSDEMEPHEFEVVIQQFIADYHGLLSFPTEHNKQQM